VTGQQMCPTCARTPEGCAVEGCGPAGRKAPRPVRVATDALERQAESFVARRSVLDQPDAEPVAGSVPLFHGCGHDCWERGEVCDHRDDLAGLHPDDLDGDGPGLDWDDGPEPPPGRRVVAIETTGERL
jgi:hypothetical protein